MFGPNRRIILYASLFLSTALLYDFLTFFRSCQDYRNRSQAGASQLPKPAEPNEIIVVLTGDRSRIPRAIQLLRLRQSALLVISGTNPDTTLTDLVNQQGNATQNVHEIWPRILVESKSSSTIENALETRKVLAEKKPAYLILVTSDYHLPRAMAIFQRAFVGLEVLAFASRSSLSEFEFSGKVVVEYVKFFLYRVQGRFRI